MARGTITTTNNNFTTVGILKGQMNVSKNKPEVILKYTKNIESYTRMNVFLNKAFVTEEKGKNCHSFTDYSSFSRV